MGAVGNGCAGVIALWVPGMDHAGIAYADGGGAQPGEQGLERRAWGAKLS
jgi:valyl-tRNA synthetase